MRQYLWEGGIFTGLEKQCLGLELDAVIFWDSNRKRLNSEQVLSCYFYQGGKKKSIKTCKILSQTHEFCKTPFFNLYVGGGEKLYFKSFIAWVN